MTCKHGTTSLVCPYCDAEIVEAEAQKQIQESERYKQEANKIIKAETQVDQPKPAFTLDDLELKLAAIYTQTMLATKQMTSPDHSLAANAKAWDGLRQANGMLQEIIAIVDKQKRDLNSIEPNLPVSSAITDALNIDKPDHYVCGVQLVENGQLIGTSLYTTVVKARKIRDILNKRFAELRVDHEAKIVNYPVF